MVRTDTEAKPLLEAVNAGHLPGISSLRTDFLRTEMTIGAALRQMTDLAVESMPARDAAQRLVGVVERADVLSRFLLDATQT